MSQQRENDRRNRDAIYEMLVTLTAMAEQLVVASRESVQDPAATAADQSALKHDLEMRKLLTQALQAMTVMNEHDPAPFPITSRVADRMKTAFHLSDQAMQTAMRLAHGQWMPRDSLIGRASVERKRNGG